MVGHVFWRDHALCDQLCHTFHRNFALHQYPPPHQPRAGLGWLAASLLANVVWVLPQYALAYGAITNNLFAGYFAESKHLLSTQVTITLLLMVVVIPITLSYGGKGKGIKIYEMILKLSWWP